MGRNAARTRLITVVLIAALAACGGAGGGGGGGGGGSASPLTVDAYYNRWLFNARSDINGGLYSYVIPAIIVTYGGSPNPRYTFTTTPGTSLPAPSVLIDPLTGLVHGTLPPGFAPGSYSFSVTVSDGSTSITAPLTLTVASCDSTSSPAPDPRYCYADPATSLGAVDQTDVAHAGRPFGGNFMVSGGTPPYHFAIASGTLPPGMSLDPGSGVVYGTPFSSAAGVSYLTTIAVSDAAGSSKPIAAKFNVQ
jgi:large repetitive protein